MSVSAPVARAALVLANDDLLAEDVRRHFGRHLLALDLVAELRLSVAAEEKDVRMERLALLHGEAVDEQPLALADTVLLSADGDHCVCSLLGHKR